MRFPSKQYMPELGVGGGGPTGPSRDDVDNARELRGEFDEVRNTIRSITALIKEEFIQALQGADAVTKDIGRDIEKDINKSLRQSLKLNEELIKAEDGVSKKLNTQAKVKEQQIQLERERERLIDLVKEAEAEGIPVSDEVRKNLKVALDILAAQDAELAKILKKLGKQKEATELYHQGLEAAFKGLSKIPILSSFIQVGKIMDKVKKAAEDGKGKFGQLGAGLKEMFSQLFNPITMITAGITGLISLFTALFKITLEYNQKLYDIATTLGTSVAKAESLYSKFQGVAGVLAKDVAKAVAGISDQLGFMVTGSSTFVATMAQLQHRIGASTSDMEGLATFSAMAGTNVRSMYGTMMGVAKVTAMSNGFMMTERQILNAMSKTSAAILFNFKGNVRELIKGIIEAKALGTTLDEIKKRGDSLLDFESSISKEFEVQAMTGKQIDFQKARQLFQNNKIVEGMKEMTKQGFKEAEYRELGNLERKTYAELLGTSTDELEKQFVLQRQIAVLGEKDGQSMATRYRLLMQTVEGRKKIEASLSREDQANLARESANEQWEKTLEKIKDTLGQILQGPVISIVNTVTSWLRNTKLVHDFGMKVRNVFVTIAEFIKQIPSYIDKIPNILNTIVKIAKGWFSISIGIATANAVAASVSIPGVGIAAGLLAGAGVYAYLSSLVPDFGGGGMAASSSTPAMTGNYGEIKPMNQSAASAAGSSAGGGGSATIKNENTSILVMDSSVLARNLDKNTTQIPYQMDSGGTNYKGNIGQIPSANFGIPKK